VFQFSKRTNYLMFQFSKRTNYLVFQFSKRTNYLVFQFSKRTNYLVFQFSKRTNYLVFQFSFSLHEYGPRSGSLQKEMVPILGFRVLKIRLGFSLVFINLTPNWW